MGGAEMRKKDDIMEPTFVVRDGMLADKEYVEWLADLKRRFLYSQAKAAVRVNTAMLEYYWSLGRDITQIQAESKWGSGFFNQLSLDLRSEFPDATGFSVTNLKYMKRWYDFYYKKVKNRQWPVDEIGHQAGDQFGDTNRQRVVDEILHEKINMPELFGHLPWGQHIEIFTRCTSLEEALYYIHKAIGENWSRPYLENQIKAGLFQVHGAAITNFDTTLPVPQSQLVKEILKDPYHFEFLSLEERYSEHDLEEALVANVTQFLLELGKGFSYVGRQMELQMPGGQTFFPDLVFYHIPQHRYVIIELKAVTYVPEFAGKLNFYVTAADKLLRGEGDNPSVGLIICKSTDKTVVEWSLQDIQKPLGVATYQLQEVVDRTVAELEQRKKQKEEEV